MEINSWPTGGLKNPEEAASDAAPELHDRLEMKLPDHCLYLSFRSDFQREEFREWFVQFGIREWQKYVMMRYSEVRKRELNDK